MSKVFNADNISEATKAFTHKTAMEEAARCLLCYDAPCSKGCPAGTNPSKFIRSIRFRNPKGAAETIRENNVLGGVCALVCPYDKFCEEACSRCGIDRPIEIGRLQSYAIEQEKAFNMEILKAPENKKTEKIACVGAGPASLAVASTLAIKGYQVTVFEKEKKAGGMLTYGLAFSRLPQETVDHDIRQVENIGVKFEFGKTVGKDVDLAGFDAVFIGIGLGCSGFPDIPGTNLAGVYTAIDFLKKARTQKENFEFGNKVVVIGGGDSAVDAAVSAKLLGAQDVRIVYRRTIEEAPADINEFHYALSLGIGITTNMAPMSLGGDDILRFIVFKGRDGESELKLAVDTVIFATGQKSDEILKIADIKLTDDGLIKVDENCRTSVANIFAAGDIVNGGKTVVEAVGAGKEAAAAIVNYLQEREGK